MVVVHVLKGEFTMEYVIHRNMITIALLIILENVGIHGKLVVHLSNNQYCDLIDNDDGCIWPGLRDTTVDVIENENIYLYKLW